MWKCLTISSSLSWSSCWHTTQCLSCPCHLLSVLCRGLHGHIAECLDYNCSGTHMFSLDPSLHDHLPTLHLQVWKECCICKPFRNFVVSYMLVHIDGPAPCTPHNLQSLCSQLHNLVVKDVWVSRKQDWVLFVPTTYHILSHKLYQHGCWCRCIAKFYF